MTTPEPEDDDGMVLQTITITRRLVDDVEVYRVDHDEDMGFVEALGLLEAAKYHFYERFSTPEEDPDG